MRNDNLNTGKNMGALGLPLAIVFTALMTILFFLPLSFAANSSLAGRLGSGRPAVLLQRPSEELPARWTRTKEPANFDHIYRNKQ